MLVPFLLNANQVDENQGQKTMKKSQLLTIALIMLLSGILGFVVIAKFGDKIGLGSLSRAFHVSNDSKTQYFIMSVPPSNNFKGNNIVDLFNKSMGTDFRISRINEFRFWDDDCQIDSDPFEVGLILPMQLACYNQKLGGQKYMAIGKQMGCSASFYVLSMESGQVDPEQLNGKKIGVFRISNNLGRLFFNEPKTITPSLITESDNAKSLFQKLKNKKIDYIVSGGFAFNDDLHFIRLVGEKLSLIELHEKANKISVNHIENMKLPCYLLTVNTTNSRFNTEEKRKDFLNKLNSNFKQIPIEKLTNNTQLFAPFSKEESTRLKGMLMRSFGYTLNSTSKDDSELEDPQEDGTSRDQGGNNNNNDEVKEMGQNPGDGNSNNTLLK